MSQKSKEKVLAIVSYNCISRHNGKENKNDRKRYKQAKIRKRRNQKEIPTPKTEVGKNKTNNQALIP